MGNADEWWGYYWKAFVTGKDKNRTNSCRQLLLKITACSPSQKLSGTMEQLHRARRGKYEKTWSLLHARFLTEKFPPPTHTFLLPPQDRKSPLGSLRGSEGTYACSSHLGRSKQSLCGWWWLLLPRGGLQCQRGLWLQAASGMYNAQNPSYFTSLCLGHV